VILRLFAAALLPLALGAAERAAELSRQAREAGLDADECYRVRDLRLAKEDARFYLTDGYLVFGRPVAGRVISAVFSGDVEGGDAEMLLMPPNRSERLSLANFTQSPNLNEHFRAGVMLFTDDTAKALGEAVRASGAAKSPEMGALIKSTWDPVVRNLVSSFEVRLVMDLLLGQADRGFFYTAVASQRLGNFDLIFDPCARDQIAIGQIAFRENRAFFDNWTVFPARSWRMGRRKPAAPDFDLAGVRIQATLEPDLTLKARTAATLTPRLAGLNALLFEMSPQMGLEEVRIEGEPAEALRRDSLRANVIRGSANELFLVVPPRPLAAGRGVRIEFAHQGKVVSQEGNRVFFVGSRTSWYPQRGLQFTTYDLTFRYPSDLNLVSTGSVVEDRTEGEWRITRRRTDSPIRLAGFNLGVYEQVSVERGGLRVEVCANRKVESALQPKPQGPLLLSPPQGLGSRFPRTTGDLVAIAPEPPTPSPTARLSVLAGDIAAAFEFMSRAFGPPPLKTLTVSPIPGAFGQGFPGLVYLSTLSYLEPRERPAAVRGELQQLFFSEILHAHETAHQWWGNTVTAATYQDEWLMEALANYAALLYIEKKNGPRALESLLEVYRERLLRKNPDGKTLESAGPVTWGTRLHSSISPDAWRGIMYEKGSWIVHMLRRRLGDAQFTRLLGEACRRYHNQPLSTEQFRLLAREFLPPRSEDPQLEEFFDHWVYGTGIPTLKLQHSVSGKAPALKLTGTVTMSEVDEDFTVLVPVEIQFSRGRPVVEWVRASNEPAKFTVALKQAPARVVLAPGEAVLARK
jgi:hypothetical protein